MALFRPVEELSPAEVNRLLFVLDGIDTLLRELEPAIHRGASLTVVRGKAKRTSKPRGKLTTIEGGAS